MLKTGRMQKSETDKFDISFGTVAVATLHLESNHHDVVTRALSEMVHGRDVTRERHVETVVTTTLRPWTRSQSTSDEDRDAITYRISQAATVEWHAPPINGQRNDWWAREDAIKTSERAVEDMAAESNNSQQLKKRYNEEIIT